MNNEDWIMRVKELGVVWSDESDYAKKIGEYFYVTFYDALPRIVNEVRRELIREVRKQLEDQMATDSYKAGWNAGYEECYRAAKAIKH